MLQEKIADLKRTIKRLALLQAHDALCLLNNSIAMPKLLYLLRTSPCFDNPLLASFDDTLRLGLSLVLNVELDDKQWSQATLQGSHGRSWSEECVHAGTFSPFGFGCCHASIPGCHPCRISTEHRRPYSYRSKEYLDGAGKNYNSNGNHKARTESVGYTDHDSDL